MIFGLLLGIGGAILSGISRYKGEQASAQREKDMAESSARQRRKDVRTRVAGSSSSGAGMVDTTSFNTDLLDNFDTGNGSEYVPSPSGWGIFASTLGSFLNSNIGQDFIGGRWKKYNG